MRPRRRWTRETVIEAAAELAARSPEQEITLAGLARHLGVRTPSLYNHVESLESLKQDIALYGVRELGERLGSAAIGRSGEDALMAIVWAYRDFAINRPGLYLATQRAPDPEHTELNQIVDEILDILKRVLEPFALSETEQIHAIRAIRSMVHGFVSLEQSGGFGIPVDLDESFQYLADMYIAQISSSHGRSMSQSMV